MTHYASVERKFAPLHSDFAREFVARRFGPELAAAIYAALPVKMAGKNKGQVKGYVRWLKCNKGGWYRTGPLYYGQPGTNGRVMTPGTNSVEIVVSPDSVGSGLSEGFWREEDNAEQRATFAQTAIRQMFEVLKTRNRYG